VHAAQLFYIRSAQKGSKHPARGRSFVLFFDSSFRLRNTWYLDMPLSGLAFEGTKLMLGTEVLLDFASPPKIATVAVDGKVQGFPTWKAKEQPARRN
jgi:hypothetical protein